MIEISLLKPYMRVSDSSSNVTVNFYLRNYTIWRMELSFSMSLPIDVIKIGIFFLSTT